MLGATDDQQEPVGNSEILAEAIPGSRLKIYPGLSHAFPFEAPDRVAADISALTRRLCLKGHLLEI